MDAKRPSDAEISYRCMDSYKQISPFLIREALNALREAGYEVMRKDDAQ